MVKQCYDTKTSMISTIDKDIRIANKTFFASVQN